MLKLLRRLVMLGIVVGLAYTVATRVFHFDLGPVSTTVEDVLSRTEQSLEAAKKRVLQPVQDAKDVARAAEEAAQRRLEAAEEALKE